MAARERPAQSHVYALQRYFHELLELYVKQFGYSAGASAVKRVTSNMGNLRNIVLLGLHPDNPDQRATIESAIALNQFSRINGHGCSDVMNKIPDILAPLQDSELQAKFITQVLSSWLVNNKSEDPEILITEGQKHFGNIQDPVLECEFCVFLYVVSY
jgi:hypothetical protein